MAKRRSIWAANQLPHPHAIVVQQLKITTHFTGRNNDAFDWLLTERSGLQQNSKPNQNATYVEFSRALPPPGERALESRLHKFIIIDVIWPLHALRRMKSPQPSSFPLQRKRSCASGDGVWKEARHLPQTHCVITETDTGTLQWHNTILHYINTRSLQSPNLLQRGANARNVSFLNLLWL